MQTKPFLINSEVRMEFGAFGLWNWILMVCFIESWIEAMIWKTRQWTKMILIEEACGNQNKLLNVWKKSV